MSIWRWADWLHPIPPEARITLGEGDTPLIRSRRLGPRLGMPNLYFKLEMTNPTGSYKDRFAVTAISEMVARGKSLVVGTSSGNTGASLSGYAAAAGIRCRIAIVETAPQEKLKQMLAYGAELYRVRGFGLDPSITEGVFSWVRERGSAPDAAVQISAYHFSPAGMSGVETLAFELVEQTSGPIHHVFCQAGGGGLTLAMARGFAKARQRGQLDYTPAVECVQPEGNDTIATPLRNGSDAARAVECTTKISGLQVPSVIDGDEVIRACRACGGTGHVVSDAEVWKVQGELAREEGIFCEPAGVVPVAGALKAAAEKVIRPEAVIVCLLTGSGFKDSPSIERMLQNRTAPTIDLGELQKLA